MGKKIIKRTSLLLFCRSCGPGGTAIDFFVTTQGLKAVWKNENLPYDYCSHDENDIAEDEHNVNLISYEEFDKFVNEVNKFRSKNVF